MNNALDGYAAVVAENEKLRARIKELEAERAQAVLDEREACASVCDGWSHADGDRCAEAIRARSKP